MWGAWLVKLGASQSIVQSDDAVNNYILPTDNTQHRHKIQPTFAYCNLRVESMDASCDAAAQRRKQRVRADVRVGQVLLTQLEAVHNHRGAEQEIQNALSDA